MQAIEKLGAKFEKFEVQQMGEQDDLDVKEGGRKDSMASNMS